MAKVTHKDDYTRIETTPDAAGDSLDIRLAVAKKSIQRGRVSLIFLTDVRDAAITPDDAYALAEQLLRYAQRARRLIRE